MCTEYRDTVWNLIAAKLRGAQLSVPDQDPAIDQTHRLSGKARLIDLAFQNPYLHFIASEFWAGVASVSVYMFYHLAAFSIQFAVSILPLQNHAPAAFLEATLHWGAALGASCTFGVVTAYQLLVLMRRLREDLLK